MANVKAKKRLFNAIMAVAAVVIIVAGVMLALGFKGGNSPSSGTYELPNLTTCDKLGNANIVRGGLGYALENEAQLQPRDQLETLSGSGISLTCDNVVGLRMGARTTVLLDAADTGFSAELKEGSAVAWAKMPLGLYLCDGEVAIDASQDALLSLTQEEGAASVTVLGGSVKLNGVDAKADQGNTITLLYRNDEWKAEVAPLSEKALPDATIDAILNMMKAGASCSLSADELNSVVADRAAQREAAQQQAIDKRPSDNGGNGNGNGTKPDNGGKQEDNRPTCTIEIRCDTILNNMGDLTSGKEPFVPKNGTILATSRVAFNEGDTVFDVLVAACKSAGIQLEYTFTALYGSNYIEGINNLYEFDCGEESGWMYKVNGWFPNYGCSKYELQDGDVIVWCYTCKGLGADVGGDVH